MYTDAVAAGGLAVVTGGASGVGFAAAERFAQAGLGVVLADLPGEGLDQAAERLRSLAAANAPVLPRKQWPPIFPLRPMNVITAMHFCYKTNTMSHWTAPNSHCVWSVIHSCSWRHNLPKMN